MAEGTLDETDDLVPLGAMLDGVDRATKRVEDEVYQRERKRVKEPPHVGRVERDVVASIVEHGRHALLICEELGLRSVDFREERMGWIFDAAVAVNERGAAVSITSIVDQLSRKSKLDAAGGVGSVELVLARRDVPAEVEHELGGMTMYPGDTSLVAMRTHARLIIEHAQRRRIIDACTKAVSKVYASSGDAATVLDETLKTLSQIEAGTDGKLADNGAILKNLQRTLPAFGGKRVVTPSGFTDLDKVLQGGFTPGDLVIIAGRPSIGKTQFVLDICADLSFSRGRGVLFFSLEMSAEQLHTRLLGARARVNPMKGNPNGIEKSRLSAAIGDLSQARILIDETPGLTLGRLRASARAVTRTQRVDLIVVDYLQLLAMDRLIENKATEVAEISKGLKNIARELKLPVVALSQLSRGVEARADKRPMLSDLRESGGIEQDADVVMFLYREEYYLKNGTPGDKVGVAEVSVSKHRNGPTGVVKLHFGRHADDPSDAPPRFGSLAQGGYE